MVHLRVGSTETRFPEQEWEANVASGRVPPEALVLSLELTGGLWRRADTIELYHFFRRSGEEERREAALGGQPVQPFAELPRIAFPRQGFSGTEILLGINLMVALILMLIWQRDYAAQLWGVDGRGGLAHYFYDIFVERHLPLGFFATLFIHADLQHLGANMISLVPGAAFVEYLHGRRVLLIYLLGGLAGSVASFLLKGRGPMSVGASGAIYALIGCLTGFVLRYRARLPRWHRWRAHRIYIPLLVLVTLPSIFHADWRAHTGGFLAGVLLGLILPLGVRGRRLLLPPAQSP